MYDTSLLLRTSPKLTGNYKILLDSTDKIYLNSINANKDLSNDRFKNFLIDKFNIDFPKNISVFFKDLAKSSVFLQFTNNDIRQPIKDIRDQYEKEYYYGVDRCLSEFVSDKLKIFAPLFITKKIPKKFVIFKMDGARHEEFGLNRELKKGYRYRVIGNGFIKQGQTKYFNQQTFVRNEEEILIEDCDYYLDDYELSKGIPSLDFLFKQSKILKIIDLEKSSINKLIESIIKDVNYNESPIYVDFNSKEITYRGISLENGVITEKKEYFGSLLDSFETISDFDKFVTDGFYRNNLINYNILNLEFSFDDEELKFFRYFGLYCDDVDFSEYELNLKDTLSLNYINSFNEDFIPLNLEKKNINSFVLGKKLSGLALKENIADKKSIFYYKVKDKINIIDDFSNNVVTSFDINDINDVIKLSDNIEIPTKVINKGAASLIFKVDGQFNFGDKISLFLKKKFITKIVADHLPLQQNYTEGDNISHYFYPYGNVINIAKAIAKAFNYVFQRDNLYMEAYSDENYVFIIDNTNAGYHIKYNRSDIIKPVLSDNISGYSNKERYRIPFVANAIGKYYQLDNGFEKIKEEHTYSEEFVIGSNDNRNYLNYLNYKVLSLNKKPSIKNNRIILKSLETIKIGVFNFYPLKDFDFSFSSDYYTSSYKSELYEFYDVKKLDIQKDAFFKFSIIERGLNGSVINIDYDNGTLIQNVFTYTIQPSDNIDSIYDNIVNFINNNSSDFFAKNEKNYISIHLKTNVGKISNTYKVIGSANLFTVISFDKIMSGGQDPGNYVVFSKDGKEAVIEYNNSYYGYNITLYNNQPVSQNFTAVNGENYKIILGNPLVLNEKYLEDEEVVQFLGFNNLGSPKIDIDNYSIKEKYRLLEDVGNEYSFLKEENLQKNIFINKFNVDFNKWVLSYGNNIRDKEYRLNISNIFEETNFSPSFYEKRPTPEYFTHEWYYIAPLPKNLLDEDLIKNNCYFEDYFDEELYKNKSFDYFTSYFTVDNVRGFDKKYEERFSLIKNVSNKNICFFKGAKFIINDNENLDGYKFSCLLQFRKYDQDVDVDPIEIKILKNKDHKNILLLINVIIEDYKVDTNEDLLMSGGYSLLYMANSLKRYNSLNIGYPYDYGRLFSVPTFSGLTTGSMSSFRGVKLNLVSDFKYTLSNNILEFLQKEYSIEDVLKEIDDDDFGTLMGYNISDESMIFSSDNQSMVIGDYIIDPNGKNIQLVSGNNVILKNNLLYACIFNGFSYFSNVGSVSLNSLYPIKRLRWFQIGGGKNYYSELIKNISFAGIKDYLASSRKALVIENGLISHSNISFSFVEPDLISLKKRSISGTEIINLEKELNTSIEQPIIKSIDEEVKIYRYSGDYTIKLDPIISFKPMKIKHNWLTINKTFNYLKGNNWSFFRDKKIYLNNSDTKTEIDHYNTNLNIIQHYHKHFEKNVLKLEKLIYPQVKEYPIGVMNFNILKNQFDKEYYIKNITKDDIVFVDGYTILNEEKSFLNTSIFNVPNLITSTLTDNEVILEKNGNEISISFNIYGIISKKLLPSIINELKKYINELEVDIEKVSSDYVKNIINLYKLDKIEIFSKEQEEGLLTINSEENTLLLIRKNFKRDVNFSTSKTSDIITIKYKLEKEFGKELNIKTTFSHK